MSDYNVYQAFLDKTVDIEKKNRRHVFGIIKAVGNTSLRLENIIVDENYPNQDILYPHRDPKRDLYEQITKAIGMETVNYDNIWRCRRVYTDQEKAAIRDKLGYPNVERDEK